MGGGWTRLGGYWERNGGVGSCLGLGGWEVGEVKQTVAQPVDVSLSSFDQKGRETSVVASARTQREKTQQVTKGDKDSGREGQRQRKEKQTLSSNETDGDEEAEDEEDDDDDDA
ncbi:hypothetical protein Pfo_026526 [Paulownia fortunei]|nr:hypothetical protein Pfo_026526 [Paulownia fortunei]